MGKKEKLRNEKWGEGEMGMDIYGSERQMVGQKSQKQKERRKKSEGKRGGSQCGNVTSLKNFHPNMVHVVPQGC